MLALRWHGHRDVRLDDVELEGSVNPGMVEAEVLFCGVCGSDIAEFAHGPFAIRHEPHRLTGHAPPVTLGHEFSARIVSVGPGVDPRMVDERVAADACWRCERCPACLAGDYNLCPNGGSIGLCSDGAFAARVRFPAYCAVVLPPSVSDRAGALLEPMAVGLHALTRGGARPGDRVVILGFGAIGAATAAVAAAIGLDVLVGEPNPLRRARAEQLGHRVFVPGDSRETAREVRRLTDGGVGLVIDATGVPAAVEGGLEMTRRGGVVVVVGLAKAAPTIDTGRMVLFERSVVGSLGYVHDLPRVASLIAAGRLDAERLVTRTVDLTSLPDEFDRMAADPGDDVKVLVDLTR